MKMYVLNFILIIIMFTSCKSRTDDYFYYAQEVTFENLYKNPEYYDKKFIYIAGYYYNGSLYPSIVSIINNEIDLSIKLITRSYSFEKYDIKNIHQRKIYVIGVFQYLPSDAIKYSFANLHHVYLSDDLDDIKIYPAGTP